MKYQDGRLGRLELQIERSLLGGAAPVRPRGLRTGSSER